MLPKPTEQSSESIRINGALLTAGINALKVGIYSHDKSDANVHPSVSNTEVWTDFVRELIQEVVISPSADGKSADLMIHGRLASILAANEAWADASKALRAQRVADFKEKREAGGFRDAGETLR